VSSWLLGRATARRRSHPLRGEPEGGRASRCASRIPPANPYLASRAMLMAGLDGVENKIHRAKRRRRTCTTCRRKKTRRSRPSATASTRR
jgi:glutamine synthetase